MGKNLSKISKPLVSKQIALHAMCYFGQAFVFCLLIDKTVLEWFLLIICGEHSLATPTNLFSRNHPTLCFSLKVQSCKLSKNKYMTASTQITSSEILTFIAVLVFKLLSHKVLFTNRRDNRNC